MRIGTAEPNSTFMNQGLALKALFEARGVAERVDILPSLSASIENARRLDTGDMDFGFMAANWIGRALRGEAPFEAPIQLCMVAPMNLGPMYFIRRAESAIGSVADLRGKRVAVGPEGSGSVQHARAIFGALGFGIGDVAPVYLDFSDGGDALGRGEVDAQLQCPIPNPAMSRLDAAYDFRVVPYAPADLEKVMARNPVYRPATMRKGDLRALTEDVAQPGVVNVLVAHERQKPGVVASVVRAIAAGADELARLNPLFRGIARLWEPMRPIGAAALEFDGVPLHEGARAGWRAAGWLG
jgi:TRAP transporter TAXI family solute receptor